MKVSRVNHAMWALSPFTPRLQSLAKIIPGLTWRREAGGYCGHWDAVKLACVTLGEDNVDGIDAFNKAQEYETCLIPLGGCGGDKYAIIDASDRSRLAGHSWTAVKKGRTYYALRTAPGRAYMHQDVMPASDGLEVDHVNHNGLDNRKDNLRTCSHRANSCNTQKQVGTLSKYKGVTRLAQRANCWKAVICREILGKTYTYHLGYFPTEEAAGAAYDKAAKDMFGEFARTNGLAE